MSQMTDKLPFNLVSGISWNAVIELTATGQSRRKVIADIASEGTRTPRFTIQLDVFDQLSVVVSGRGGERVQTPPIDSVQFASQPVWLQGEAFAAEPPGADNPVRIQVRLRINGREMSTADGEGDFGGHVSDGQNAFGASLEGDNPATFKLYELVIRGSPLTEAENQDLKAYFANKYKLEVPA